MSFWLEQRKWRGRQVIRDKVREKQIMKGLVGPRKDPGSYFIRDGKPFKCLGEKNDIIRLKKKKKNNFSDICVSKGTSRCVRRSKPRLLWVRDFGGLHWSSKN